MSLTVTTWNINSVRLRIQQVLRFLREQQPDVLCLQETKCPDDRFPLSDFVKAGYPHVAIHGQKGYHGVAVISRLPLMEVEPRAWCDKTDARYIRARMGAGAGRAAGLDIHNFYVPAGGDIPDPAVNDKFAHKLQFLDELKRWGQGARPTARPAIMVGDLNIAPYEHDVWSHKQLLDVVSHTPVESEGLEEVRELGQWVDAIRPRVPLTEKVYTWWSYRSPDWAAADKGRRLDHVWLSPDLGGTVAEHRIGRECRGWERPSDHVPVTVKLAL